MSTNQIVSKVTVDEITTPELFLHLVRIPAKKRSSEIKRLAERFLLQTNGLEIVTSESSKHKKGVDPKYRASPAKAENKKSVGGGEASEVLDQIASFLTM